MTDKWIYLPIEVKVREVHAKLLFAKHAALNGYKVVLGRKAEVISSTSALPPGLFYGMWVQENFLEFYRDLKRKGFIITGLDEEGLVTFSDKMYANFKVSKETLSFVDHFFAWGEYQKKVVSQYAPAQLDISAVGNLRFDLLRPEMRHILAKESQDCVKRHGKYILLVSSFSLSNHFSGAEPYMKSLRKSLVIRSDEDEAFLRRYMDLQGRVFEEYKKSVQILAKKYPDFTFVIRPHPSEQPDLWKDCARSHSNIVIEPGGNIHSWLLGAKAMIHHFCTTALEAYAANIPSIAYRPFKDSEIESDLPYRGSVEAGSHEELEALLQKLQKDDATDWEERRKESIPYLRNYIQNLSGDYSYETMLKIVGNLDIPDHRMGISYFLYVLKWLVIDAKIWVISLFKGRSQTYTDHKFLSLDRKEITDILREMPGEGKLSLKRINRFCYMLALEND